MARKQESREDKLQRMTHQPVERLVCKLAGPSIVIMMVSALYNMADTYFVGTLGTSATGAVGITFSLMAIIQAVGFFFGHGSGNYISRQMGANQMDKAVGMAAVGFFSVFATCWIIAIAGLVFLEPLARMLGATDTILPHALQYLRFILLGAPFIAGSFTLNNLLRFQGSSFYGMIGMTTGAVLNIVLDPLFIYGLNMGVAGAGFATMLSQMVSCAILYICCNRPGNIPVRLKHFRPKRSDYMEVVRGGAPSLCRQGIGSIAVLSLNHAAGIYGDAAIAAISIVSRVGQFAISALMGLGQGFQPVCGMNYGAKLYGRVRRAFWFCVKLSFVVLAGLSVAGFLFAPQIISLFQNNDPEVIRIGARMLRLQAVTFPFMSMVIVSNMMLQTIGRAIPASLLALGRQGLFFFPLLLTLVPWVGLLGIQLLQPLADLLTFLLTLPLVLWVLREMRLKEETIENAD